MTEIPKDEDIPITYQQQYRKCGELLCSTCRHGPGHGPYWREGGRLRSKYLGKVLPQEDGQSTSS